MNIISTM